MSVNKKGAGRPVGSTVTANSLLRGEMKATASTMAKIRRLAEEQIEAIRKHLELTADVSLKDRLDTVETMTTLIEKLAKTMESGAKHLVTKDSENGAGNANDAEAMIAKFIGGGKE